MLSGSSYKYSGKQLYVLQLLTVANRSKAFFVLWPGTVTDGKLVYAEDGYADYKEYDVEQYDITCVV